MADLSETWDDMHPCGQTMQNTETAQGDMGEVIVVKGYEEEFFDIHFYIKAESDEHCLIIRSQKLGKEMEPMQEFAQWIENNIDNFTIRQIKSLEEVYLKSKEGK
jgi:hypothetical protein